MSNFISDGIAYTKSVVVPDTCTVNRANRCSYAIANRVPYLIANFGPYTSTNGRTVRDTDAISKRNPNKESNRGAKRCTIIIPNYFPFRKPDRSSIRSTNYRRCKNLHLQWLPRSEGMRCDFWT